jgi:hypothetical protein
METALAVAFAERMETALAVASAERRRISGWLAIPKRGLADDGLFTAG